MPTDIDGLVKQLEGMTVLELVALKNKIEDEWGITAVQPMTMPLQEMEATPVEEQTEFTVKLTNIGPGKIAVIKLVREKTGFGLKESKELVDKAPTNLIEGLDAESANEFKKNLEAAGAEVELI